MSNFTNIYASPIVSFLVAHSIINLPTTCAISWNHAPEYTTTIGRQTTTLEINSNNSYRVYAAVIDGHCVTFTFSGSIGGTADVDFQVDYSFTRRELPRRTKCAVVRWLLAVWTLECANYKTYIAMPSGDTDAESGSQWRGDYYAKFGFAWITDKSMSYTPSK